MHDWISSGRIVDIVLALVAIEALALMYWVKLKPLPVLATLAPGVCLMMALRVALTGGAAPAVLMWLTLALPFHLIDLWVRHKK